MHVTSTALILVQPVHDAIFTLHGIAAALSLGIDPLYCVHARCVPLLEYSCIESHVG